MAKVLVNSLICLGIVLTGASVTAGIVVARRAPESPQIQHQKVTNVEVQRLDESTVNDTFTLTGSLDPWKEVLLSSETKGKIEWQGVDNGDTIEAGDELLKIDRLSAGIRLNQAQVQFKMAALELERVQQLHEKGIGSSQDLDKARVDRDVAKSNLNTREIELTYTILTAPFDGVVEKIHEEKDEFVNIGTALVSVIQIHKLKMVVGIADQDVPYFSVGDPVTVLVDAYGDQKFSGVIHRIGQRADSATHTFETKIELDNASGNLKPGMIARAVMVRKSYPNSIIVPIFSILTDLNKKFVFIEENGEAVRKDVVIGLYQGNIALIDQGLNSGDRLIVAGHRNLRDGGAVKVHENSQ